MLFLDISQMTRENIALEIGTAKTGQKKAEPGQFQGLPGLDTNAEANCGLRILVTRRGPDQTRRASLSMLACGREEFQVHLQLHILCIEHEDTKLFTTSK